MTKEGEPLLEVVREASGPVVRLLQAAARIDLPGALRIEADAIELRARTGEVRIEAADDVVVRGGAIRLN
jgi:uncharacterized protein (DUF2345 family)